MYYKTYKYSISLLIIFLFTVFTMSSRNEKSVRNYRIIQTESDGQKMVSYDMGKNWIEYNKINIRTVYLTKEDGSMNVSHDLGRTWEKITVGTNSAGDINQLKFFPVPAEKKLNVQLNLQQSGYYSIYLMNSLGSVELEQKFMLGKGLNEFSLDIRNLSAGMYLVKVHGANYSTTGKLIVK